MNGPLSGQTGVQGSLLRTRLIRAFGSVGPFYSALVFEPRDLWIGLYWTRDGGQFVFYICLLPTLVLKVVRDAR